MSHVPALEPRCGSWVAIRKADGKVLGEFFKRSNVARFNPERVQVLTTAQYLQQLGRLALAGAL